MDALILSGGLGLRLRSVLDDCPKPLAVVAGKPFLEYLLLWLKTQGVTSIILCTGYRGELIQEYFGCGNVLGLRLRYSCESEPLGTGGALKLAGPLIESEEFLVLNGDSFFDVDLRELISTHRRRRAQATIALAEVEDTHRYGSVEMNAQGEIVRFLEKGRGGDGFVNAGVYVFRAEILALIPQGCAVSLEHEIFPNLVGRGLYGLPARGYFVDIGVPDEYLRLQADPGGLLAAVA